MMKLGVSESQSGIRNRPIPNFRCVPSHTHFFVMQRRRFNRQSLDTILNCQMEMKLVTLVIYPISDSLNSQPQSTGIQFNNICIGPGDWQKFTVVGYSFFF